MHSSASSPCSAFASSWRQRCFHTHRSRRCVLQHAHSALLQSLTLPAAAWTLQGIAQVQVCMA